MSYIKNRIRKYDINNAKNDRKIRGGGKIKYAIIRDTKTFVRGRLSFLRNKFQLPFAMGIHGVQEFLRIISGDPFQTRRLQNLQEVSS